jgi:hypothetical protein
MGLAISVGSLASALEANSEVADWLCQAFREVNRVLAAHGLPPHIEPETFPAFAGRRKLSFDRGLRRGLWLSGMPYSWLHYLRRALAFARQAPGEFRPVKEGEEPWQDKRVDYELSAQMASHVICHSDVGGFYVPIDFPEPLYDDRDREHGVPGAIIGSSQRALQELTQVASLLDIPMQAGELSDKDAVALVQEAEGSHPY